MQEEGHDLSDVSTAIRGEPTPGATHRRMSSQGALSTPFLGEEPLWGISTTGEQGATGQRPDILRRPVPGNRPVGLRKKTLSPPPGLQPQSMQPSSSEDPYKNMQAEPNSSRSLFDPLSKKSDTNIGGKLDMSREEEDISHAKTTSNFDEYELGNIRLEDGLSNDNNDNDNTRLLEGCPAENDIHSSRLSWLSISILMLSIYSTIFSGIWVVLAFLEPRYGRHIHTGGKITPSTASTLFALFAKTIELSFVTVFVTFLGQVLTRRSLMKASHGVTIAELSMRNWVIQPGSMITHWETLKHASLSFLGVITLTAAIVSMFYTTASDSLVSPHLKYGRPEQKSMFGLVKASYANPDYIMSNCQTPIKPTDDQYSGETCVNIEHAGQAYQNVLAYLGTWQSGNNGSTELSKRPLPTAVIVDNTTAISVTGSWVQTDNSDIDVAFKKHNRIVNNITMSMPHAGVFSAARDRKNDILQPEDLAGVGEYSLRAAVVSPTINVLCVNMKTTELDPLVYVRWPHATTTESINFPTQKIAWQGYQSDVTQAFSQKPFLNSTVVDDIFHWGKSYNRLPPVFPMLPIDYNSILNVSVAQSDSNYILLKSSATSDYTLCQMRSWLSSDCSTQYNVSGTSGGHLRSHCELPQDGLAYKNSVPNSPAFATSSDYREVAAQLLTSLALNTGVSNANASSTRLLSQLTPVLEKGATKFTLSPIMPSLAEALAVISGSSLLLSSQDAQLHQSSNSSRKALNPPEYYQFAASLASQQFTSGSTANWQKMFYVVLMLVFMTNIFCLIYFFLTSGLVTDFTETQNLFALAVNSPGSSRLSGSCGAGPNSDQLKVDWHVCNEPGSGHFYIKEGEEIELSGEMRKRRKHHNSMISYDKLSKETRTWL